MSDVSNLKVRRNNDCCGVCVIGYMDIVIVRPSGGILNYLT